MKTGPLEDVHAPQRRKSHVDSVLTYQHPEGPSGGRELQGSQGWKIKRALTPAWNRPRPSSARDDYSSAPSSSSSPTSMSIDSESHLQQHYRLPIMPTSSPTASHEKKPGFLKRHFAHRRNSSVTASGHGTLPISPPARAQTHAIDPSTSRKNVTSSATSTSPSHGTAQPRSALRRPSSPTAFNSPQQQPKFDNSSERPDSLQVADHDAPVHQPQIILNGIRDQFEGIEYPDGLPTPLSTHSSKRGIKWAEDYGDDNERRPRRDSSAATCRRSSIYSKSGEGGAYLEGVDRGVGSKARRLSVHLPEEIDVDICVLEKHFNVMARMSQKDIGEGGAAVVRVMRSKTAGHEKLPKDRLYAVKEFRTRDHTEEEEFEYERKIKSEYAISKSCQHPNIVETYRLCHSHDRYFHVMEYCELGDLQVLISKNYFSREDRNCMFKQLLRGLDYLHARGIAHRDIKADNLLVNKEGCLKIADFGTGEVFCGQHPGLRNCRQQSIIDPDEPIRLCAPGWLGSRPYMAPEIYQRTGEYDPRAVDVWSAAIVYISLCVGGTPWPAASQEQKNYSIYCRTWEEWKEKFPDGEIKAGRPLPAFAHTKQFQSFDDMPTKVMIFGMLHPDPQNRWTIRQALETKTVTEWPCCQQTGYSDDIKTRQKKALHNHVPPKESKGPRFLKPSYQ